MNGLIHIGRKVSEKLLKLGYREVSAIHLGKGIWMIRCERIDTVASKKILKF